MVLLPVATQQLSGHASVSTSFTLLIPNNEGTKLNILLETCEMHVAQLWVFGCIFPAVSTSGQPLFSSHF